MKQIAAIEKDFLKKNLPDFKVGDQVRVHLKVQEGDKTRTQIFAGTVIRKKRQGTAASFSVLKESRGGETVEKVFPLHSPAVEKVVVTLKGKPRRSRLYYLRKKQ